MTAIIYSLRDTLNEEQIAERKHRFRVIASETFDKRSVMSAIYFTPNANQKTVDDFNKEVMPKPFYDRLKAIQQLSKERREESKYY